jgi:hypothetical protein
MRGILPKSIVGKTDRMSGIKSKDGGNVKSRILRPRSLTPEWSSTPTSKDLL